MPVNIQNLHSANDIFQRIEVLKRNRHKRHQYQEFFVEGVEALNLAKAQAWELRCICFSAAKDPSHWAADYIATANPDQCYALTAELMARLSDKENPSELVAVVKHRIQTLDKLPSSTCPLFLLLDRPMNPGNLGSTIRSAAAFGVTAIIICGHSCDPFDSVCIRSSIGTIFAMPLVQLESPAQLDPWLQKLRAEHPTFQIVGTSHTGTVPINKTELSKPSLLLLGNEGAGLSRYFMDLSEVLTRIPLGGVTTSLNLSSAATVYLYEAWRQRAGGVETAIQTPTLPLAP